MSQLAFDGFEAGRQAEAGMDQAWGASRVQIWKMMATAWLMGLESGSEIHADDLIGACGLPDEGVNANNVVGAWFSAQSKAHRIMSAGKMRKSERVVRHGNRSQVWRVA